MEGYSMFVNHCGTVFLFQNKKYLSIWQLSVVRVLIFVISIILIIPIVVASPLQEKVPFSVRFSLGNADKSCGPAAIRQPGKSIPPLPQASGADCQDLDPLNPFGDDLMSALGVRLRLGVRLAQHDASTGFTAANIAGPPGKALPMAIMLPGEDFGAYALLMLRGLPQGFKLSAGIDLGGSWAVALSDVPELRLAAPAGYEGAFLLEVLLVRERNTEPERRMVAVVIRPDTEETRGEPRAPPETSASNGVEGHSNLSQATRKGDNPVAAAPRIAAAEERKLLQQAAELMKQGNVNSARLVFQALAVRGSARGAFGMAQTFDPKFLDTVFTIGLEPDMEEAKRWYRQAATLGHAGALDRLHAIEAAGL